MGKVKTQALSVTQYAKLRNITRSAVNQAILNSHKMLGVKSVEKVGSTYVLMVDLSVFEQN